MELISKENANAFVEKNFKRLEEEEAKERENALTEVIGMCNSAITIATKNSVQVSVQAVGHFEELLAIKSILRTQIYELLNRDGYIISENLDKMTHVVKFYISWDTDEEIGKPK